MPASRIVFVLGDLVAEVQRLRPGVEVVPIELRLDEPTFVAVVGEIENHYGQHLGRTTVGSLVVATFGGVQLVTFIGGPLEARQEKTSA